MIKSNIKIEIIIYSLFLSMTLLCFGLVQVNCLLHDEEEISNLWQDQASKLTQEVHRIGKQQDHINFPVRDSEQNNKTKQESFRFNNNISPRNSVANDDQKLGHNRDTSTFSLRSNNNNDHFLSKPTSNRQSWPHQNSKLLVDSKQESVIQPEIMLSNTTRSLLKPWRIARGTSDTLLTSSSHPEQTFSECALILQRTYIKNGGEVYHGTESSGKTEQACISYRQIDAAIEQAKHKLRFWELQKTPEFGTIHTSLEPSSDIIAALGEVNMLATQLISDMFDLSNDELLNGLPLIDMSKTNFRQICPLLVRQDIKCEVTRFRTFTGHCNNLKHPTWGAAMTPFARYLPPVHEDGIQVPRKSVIVSDLPIPPFEMVPGHNSVVDGDEEVAAAAAAAAAAASDHMLTRQPILQRPRQHVPHFVVSNRHEPTDMLAAAASVGFPSRAQLDPLANIDSSGTERGPHQSSHKHLMSQETVMFPGRVQQRGNRMSQQKHTPVATNSNGDIIPLATSLKASKRIVGADLPSARLVSSIVHRDIDLPNHDFSILFMSWGQLLDHDMSRAAQPPPELKCCNPENAKHNLCLPIKVPRDDPLYSKFNVRCLEFRRSLAGLRPSCVLGPRVHQNAITAPIDANFVYGSSQADADSLRMFSGGRLRDRDWFRQEGLKPLLPAQETDPDKDCIGRPQDLFCFKAGDVRANEQTHLTVLHTIYMRQHNRMADKLAILNPHWDDERVYQETRHIMAATVQHVMLNEYLPLLVGPKMVELYNLSAISSLSYAPLPLSEHYWHGYDASVTTSVSNSFAAAAFRQGHTFIQATVERYNKFHEFVAEEKLHRLLKQPFLIYTPGVLDELIGGMINQPSQSFDPFLTEEISGMLFKPPEAKFGHDLASINLQRGREQGLPGYNIFREWCGLPRAETFDQLEPFLTNRTAFQYSKLYKHVDDIDLWSAGISERKLPGAAVGPTFACLIARQFSNTRRGDRFWYENPGLPSSFTPKQLAEIRKILLARIICSNSDDLPTIQRFALRMPHPVLNERVPCHSLPDIDLSHWIDNRGI